MRIYKLAQEMRFRVSHEHQHFVRCTNLQTTKKTLYVCIHSVNLKKKKTCGIYKIPLTFFNPLCPVVTDTMIKIKLVCEPTYICHLFLSFILLPCK